tara:strand:+ start:259 stop:1014 length:756 start_codon:yes stop_codon:yes gene_type:complete
MQLSRALVLLAGCAVPAAGISRGDSFRKKAREMMNLTEPQLDDLMARPSHYDEHGMHQLELKDGTICIADSLKHDLKIIYPSAILQRTLGGSGTAPGLFRYPRGLAEGIVNRTRIEVDGSPSTYSVPVLYVADYGNSRVQMLRLSDGEPMTIYGSGSELSNPEGLYMHEDRLYVVDRGNHRIVVLNHELHYLFHFGEYGLRNGQFDNPAHVSVYNDLIWVSDRDAAVRIQNFHLNGTWFETLRSTGGGPDD